MHVSILSTVALFQGALIAAAPLAPSQLGGEGPVTARSIPIAVGGSVGPIETRSMPLEIDGGVGPVEARDVGISVDGSASVPILPRGVAPTEPIVIEPIANAKRESEAAAYANSLGGLAGGLKEKRTNEQALYADSLGALKEKRTSEQALYADSLGGLAGGLKEKRGNGGAAYANSLGGLAGGLKEKRTNEQALYADSLGGLAGGLKRSIPLGADIEVAPREIVSVESPIATAAAAAS